jgi:hypothetical protein
MITLIKVGCLKSCFFRFFKETEGNLLLEKKGECNFFDWICKRIWGD